MRPLADLISDLWRAQIVRMTRKQAQPAGIPVPKKHPWNSKRPKAPTKDNTVVQSLFLAACLAHGIREVPVAEYRFAAPRRQWRFDWLFGGWLALEIEGGVWSDGAHVRGGHFLSDMEKYNEAAILGYVVIRCTPEDVESGAAFALVARALGSREDQP